ncbi:hypothetical protein Sste5346_003795 [Sporothrix stenoceras]|uniref:Dynamin family protein n=1 Tax=Sporothrix stenoceras TaxID=5173 RepID=A0ABR3ZDU4_9PEZI
MAPFNIQSQDYRDLLDIIDSLRSQGLDRYVALPEIIVCGDQSSGKSSVLEAISGLSFPTKDNLCTRFATELILRRHPAANISVSIVPHHSRTASEKAKLHAFTAIVDAENPDVGPVIEAAKLAMGLADSDDGDDVYKGSGSSVTTSRRFSNDILRIELSGPKQQHLTLVDLPGLFEAGNAEQSADEAPIVRKLVLDYMTRPRSIILAVVSAAYDFANQAVTQLAREVDPHGARTMGLITKPDKLDVDSDSERAFVKMARNRDVYLELGWHVLRNRGHDMRAATSAERDAKETEFFAKPGSAWLSVPPAYLGIGPLRPRLSTVLMDQILSQLPAILTEVDSLLGDCRLELTRLGTTRATVLEQRQYLSRISSQFTELVTAAVNGSYTDAGFFENMLQPSQDLDSNAINDDNEGGSTKTSKPNDKGYRLRLRAVVQNRLILFAKDIHDRGQTRVIVDDDFDDLFLKLKSSKVNTIRRCDYIKEVKGIISMSRGRELPGTFNPMVVSDLFRDQSKNWRGMAEVCAESILRSCFHAIAAALRYITIEDTAQKILQFRLDPTMKKLKSDIMDEIGKLTVSNTKGHPISYNHYLTETVQKVRIERLEKKLSAVLQSQTEKQATFVGDLSLANIATSLTEPDIERVAASDAVDCMEAYYKVALKTFVDNVSVLVVEQCLLSKLPGLLTPDAIYSIPDDEVGHLAGENKDATAERFLDEHHLPEAEGVATAISEDASLPQLDQAAYAPNIATVVAVDNVPDYVFTLPRKL